MTEQCLKKTQLSNDMNLTRFLKMIHVYLLMMMMICK